VRELQRKYRNDPLARVATR